MNNTEKGNLTWFPFLEEIVGTDQSLLSDIASAIYIQELLKTFDGYFSTGNLESCDHWIRNMFLFQLCATPDDYLLKEKIINIQHDDATKMVYKVKILENFCA